MTSPCATQKLKCSGLTCALCTGGSFASTPKVPLKQADIAAKSTPAAVPPTMTSHRSIARVRCLGIYSIRWEACTWSAEEGQAINLACNVVQS